MIEGVIAEVLKANAVVTAALGTYQGAPAIFAVSIPDDCANRAVRIQSISARDFSVHGKDGAEMQLDVTVYDDKAFSRKDLRAAGMKIYRALQRSSLMPHIASAGYSVVKCNALPPVDADDAEGFPGARVDVQVTFLEA